MYVYASHDAVSEEVIRGTRTRQTGVTEGCEQSRGCFARVASALNGCSITPGPRL